MKLKVDQIRTYDDAGFRRRAACLCFKSECESEVLLVSSSRCQNLWVVPGGGLEPGEEPEATAVREVKEEAGVVGKLGRRIGVFENKERMTRTYVFVLIVENLEDNYDDAGKIGRLRNWFSLEEATKKLSEHKPVQQEYIDKLCQDKDHQVRFSSCSKIPSDFSHLSSDPKFVDSKCSRCNQAYKEALHPESNTYAEHSLNGSNSSQILSDNSCTDSSHSTSVESLPEDTNGSSSF